jgi:hypothetical protein
VATSAAENAANQALVARDVEKKKHALVVTDRELSETLKNVYAQYREKLTEAVTPHGGSLAGLSSSTHKVWSTASVLAAATAAGTGKTPFPPPTTATWSHIEEDASFDARQPAPPSTAQTFVPYVYQPPTPNKE